LKADDKHESRGFYKDRAGFVGDIALEADRLESTSDQKESESYEVDGDEELVDRGLEVGHERLTFRVVDHQDEEPDGNESHHDTEFNSALSEETKRCRGNGLHDV